MNNWSLSRYNLICYGGVDSDIFRSSSGSTRFKSSRLFEYTSEHLVQHYKSNLESLAELPTLVVAECYPNGNPKTPAFFSRIDRVHEQGDDIIFRFQHLYSQFSSEEVFGWGDFDTKGYEHSRTHWAIKEGDLIERIFGEITPEDNEPRFFSVDSWPLPVLDHIAVMMPFAESFIPVYETIKETCNDLRMEALRVDDIYGPKKIMDDVFSTIIQSRLVISDLTERNPNVLYETGLAHALNCDVLLLVQNKQDVPFDLAQFRYIQYLPNGEGFSKLKRDLGNNIKATLEQK